MSHSGRKPFCIVHGRSGTFAEDYGWAAGDCVAVARRLAVIMHAMWRDGTVFEMNEEAAAAMAA